MEYGGTFLNVEMESNTSIQSLISSYFNNPIMTKLENKNNQSCYYSKVNTKLLTQNRYLIAITNLDNNKIGTNIYLKNIDWTCFQARYLNSNYKLNTINYYSNILDDYYINTVSNEGEYTKYKCSQIPNIEVYIINKSGKIYPNKATLCNAIEEYQTLINII